jgi:hypothetical protein
MLTLLGRSWAVFYSSEQGCFYSRSGKLLPFIVHTPIYFITCFGGEYFNIHVVCMCLYCAAKRGSREFRISHRIRIFVGFGHKTNIVWPKFGTKIIVWMQLSRTYEHADFKWSNFRTTTNKPEQPIANVKWFRERLKNTLKPMKCRLFCADPLRGESHPTFGPPRWLKTSSENKQRNNYLFNIILLYWTVEFSLNFITWS